MGERKGKAGVYSIIVADDEEELRKAIIRKIDWEKIGFFVVGEAENGVEALELVEKKQPDLLLTDIRMPFISGIELARQIREVRPSTQIAFISGYDDFTYAQQAISYNIISYMLKPITMADLTKELIIIKQKIDHLFQEFYTEKRKYANFSEFLLPLLLDNYYAKTILKKEQYLKEEAIKYHILSEEETSFSFAVIAIVLREKNGKNRTRMEYVDAIESILKKYVKSFSFYSGGKIVCLLIAPSYLFEKYLHIIAGELIQRIERILKLYCTIGISRIVTSLAGCHEAYQEAVDAISYARQTESSVRYISDEERTTDFDMEHILSFVTEIENLIRGASEQELKDYLEELFETFRIQKSSPIELKFLLLQLFSSVTRIVYTVSGWEEFIQRLNFYDGMLQETKEYFIQFCLSARELICSQKKKSGQILCDKALQIIETQYSNPELSLVSVSNEINISPNYLSSLIKKYTKKTFVDLLTQKRMKVAKQLLLYTTMKIREISKKCGYSDQHYFSYCFKKSAGVSPNGLRQQNGEDIEKD